MDGNAMRDLMRQVIQEYAQAEQARVEPTYRNELVEERKRRESLERRINDLVAENRKSQQIAAEAERNATLRGELQRMGITKVDLAFRAVKDEVGWSEDGRLVGRRDGANVPLSEYLRQFVDENPELLPARISGGSGAMISDRGVSGGGPVTLESIRPGMSREELDRVREEIARLASQTLGRG